MSDRPAGVVSSRDVARVASLSQSTVSRVINGHASVGADLRERVELAMRELGYVPNAAARSLITRRTRVLGLLISNITNAFFGELVDAATSQALERGYSVMLGVVPIRARGQLGMQASQLRVMAEQRVDGLILTSALSGDAEMVATLLRPSFPVVGVRSGRDVPFDTVAVDYEGGSRLATSHLLSHGRRRIAFLGGRSDSIAAAEHLAGHLKAIETARLDVDTRLISTGEFTYASAYERTRALVEDGMEVDGFVSPADSMALGCLDALADVGWRVPVNAGVVGFDDIPAASLRAVNLTTIKSSPSVLGSQAVDLVLDRIEDGYRGPARHVVVAAEIVVRGSCGAHEADGIATGDASDQL